MAYHEHITEQQSNLNWGESFKMGVKAPAIADRIFETYADADNYVKDTGSSAVAGLIISVIHDTTHIIQPGTENLNGIYYVNASADGSVNWEGYPTLYLYKQSSKQSDWNVTDTSDPAYIKNKPVIPEQEEYRTINHEKIIGGEDNINIHDGFYFPNAVQDADGNWYGAVIIGDQVWLGENLFTTKYFSANGGQPVNIIDASHPETIYYTSNGSSSIIPVEESGYWYNQYAVAYSTAEISGISPDGWRVPSKTDVENLLEYLGKQERFILDNDATKVAKSLASNEFWTVQGTPAPYTPANDLAANNGTGFSAQPAGFTGVNPGLSAEMWCLTESDASNAWCMQISGNSPSVNLYSSEKSYGRGARLISNMNPVQFRAWYVNEYGSMQHHFTSSDYETYTIPD